MKIRLKIADIRKDDETKCPFGLPIPFSCGCAGEIIDQLAPLGIMGRDSTSAEKEAITDANVRVLAWRLMNNNEVTVRCRYAGHILEEQDAVECNYDDTAPGVVPSNVVGNPTYSQVFMGTAINGLYTFPIGYYADYNTSRNLFYGIYSLQGSMQKQLVSESMDRFFSNKPTNKTNINE